MHPIETLLEHDRAEWRPAADARSFQPRVDVSPSRTNRPPISARQLDTLALVAEGYSSREIAAILRLRETTVKQYVAKARRKLGASNRAHAVAICFRLGMLRWSDPTGARCGADRPRAIA